MSQEHTEQNNDAVQEEAREPRAADSLTSSLPFETTNDSLGVMMAQNFIQYASYVIKDRAIPELIDGLKPVQRRILHSLHEIDDGRFHKVANVIGHAMKYHPHGDASIGSALVVLANKEYFIDRQGNFGNILTGDQASAARYIECRLTPLAREVLFNSEITDVVDSYDGRNREPVAFPAKVPVLLMLGADGIAVGMSTRIMPHNFVELIKAQINILKDKPFKVYPDFLTGGTMDASEYDDGNGRIKLRAKIEAPDSKTLVIREIPATTTTESLIASIEDAARKGKIKIAGINDYTTDHVEIEIKLPRGIYAEDTRKRLFAYTDCEVAISTSLIVIRDNRPEIMTVSDVLRFNTARLVKDLERELQIELGKLQERFHERTLVRIFIEERVYKRIEESKTYETVKAEVRAGLEPFGDRLRRDVTDEDIEHLLQIQIRRISRFDIDKNRHELDTILKQIDDVQNNLENLTQYAIDWLQELLKKYGKPYRRRTKITELETITAREVALKNIKVGHDRLNHFIGSDVKNSNKNEEPLVCTEFDRLVLLQNTGKFKVVPIPDRLYVGQVKYLLTADRDQVYCMIYRHRPSGRYYVKRFQIDSYIMNRTYSTIPKGCIIENLYTNYGVVVRAEFKHKGGNEEYIDIDFDEVELRSKGARGFKLTDREIASFTQLRRGTPTPVADDEPDDGNDDDSDRDAPPRRTPSAEPDTTGSGQGRGGSPTEPPDQAPAGPDAAETAAKPADSNAGNGGQQSPKNARKSVKPPADSVEIPAEKTSGADPTPPNLAKEWQKRSLRAARVPAKEAPATAEDVSSDVAPTTAPAPAPKGKADDPAAPVESRKRTRIDEETPFFLE